MVAFCRARLRAKSPFSSNICEGVGWICEYSSGGYEHRRFASPSTTRHAQHASRGFAARILKCPTPSQIFE